MSYPIYYVPAGDVLPILFDTFDGGTGASITLTGLAATDIEIYKDGSATQRASDAGYTLLDTDGIDFDGITGIHGFSIDTSDNTDAGFYAVGAWYHVVVSSVTIDAQTVNFIAAAFRIMESEGTAGVPDVNVSHISDDSTAANNCELMFDGTGYAGGTTKLDVNTATITAGAITAAAIATGAIDADAIADNAIDAGAIAADAITAAKIADGSITAIKLADNVITAAKIATGAIDADAIADNAIDAGAIAADAITAAKIADGAIDAATFAAGAINAAAIANGAIDADTFAAGAINAAAIADGAIDAATFAAGAINAAAIATGAIDADAIADNAIDAGAIAADAITAAKIADGAIDAATFAAGAINAAAIAADAIGASELAADAVAEIADAVWDEASTGHTDAGKAGAQMWTDVDAILVDTAEIGTAGAGLTAVPWNAAWDAEVQSEVDDAIGAALADSVPADGSLPSLKQAVYMIVQFLSERSVSGTTVTVKKVDGSTSLMTFTLNDATTPTSITRAT